MSSGIISCCRNLINMYYALKNIIHSLKIKLKGKSDEK